MLLGCLAKFNRRLAYLVDYQPYRVYGRDNPDRDENTFHIMDLKCDQLEKRDAAIEYFLWQLNPCIERKVAIAVVPSHDPAKRQTGIRLLARKLARRKYRIDATPCLIRKKLVAKKSAGGSRSLEVDLESIYVTWKKTVAGQNVVLLDDVTTTGNSLKACQQLLLKAGAARVQRLAVGKTV